MSINATTEDLITGVIRFGPGILEFSVTDLKSVDSYLNRLNQEKLNYPRPVDSIDHNRWFIPKSYQDIDIEEYLISVCPEENYQRLAEELELFQKNKMIPVLKTVKYIVDTLRENNVLWGVGRGSSVASYVLFLLGVHKIDSVKYNLPIEEFFKEI